MEAAVAWGLKPTDDFNGAAQEGVGLYQVTCKRGRRWTVADGYLGPDSSPARSASSRRSWAPVQTSR